jgi:hypothetical protein
MWTVGDFAKVATRTVPAAEAIVERLGIGDGSLLLEPEYLLSVIELPG